MQKDSSTPQSRSFLLVWPFIVLEPSTACCLCILMAQMAALSRPGLQFILRGTRKVDICLVLVAIHTTAFAHIGGEYPPNFGAGSGTCQVQADGFPSFAVNGSLIMEETRCTSHRVDERACWLLVGYLCPYRITFLNRVISTHRQLPQNPLNIPSQHELLCYEDPTTSKLFRALLTRRWADDPYTKWPDCSNCYPLEGSDELASRRVRS